MIEKTGKGGSKRNYYQDAAKLAELVYLQKQHKYGNSFPMSLKMFGLGTGLGRVFDKMSRVKQLERDNTEEGREALKDALIDAANYSLMMWAYVRELED